MQANFIIAELFCYNVDIEKKIHMGSCGVFGGLIRRPYFRLRNLGARTLRLRVLPLLALALSPLGLGAAEPPEIPSLAVHLDASNVEPGEDGLALRWKDGSGNGNDFTAPSLSQAPAITNDSLPALRFRRNEFLKSAPSSLLDTDRLSLFIVLRPGQDVSCSCVISSSFRQGAGTRSSDIWGVQATRRKIHSYARSADGAATASSNDSRPQWMIHSVVWNSTASLDSWTDGVSEDPQAGASAVPCGHIATRIGNMDAYQIKNSTGTLEGSSKAGGSFIDIAEIIICSEALGEQQRISVENYLRQKYFIDNAPPSPVAVFAAGNPLEAKIAFSEEIDPASILAEKFVLDNGTAVISATPCADGRSARLGFKTRLEPRTHYRLSVSGIKDNNGSIMPQKTDISFEFVEIPSDRISLWLRADRNVLPAPDASISAWFDSSANSNNAFPAKHGLNPPVLEFDSVNSLPSVSFGGGRGGLSCGRIPELETDTVSWFAVFKSGEPAAKQFVVENSYSGGAMKFSGKLWGIFVKDSIIYTHSRSSRGFLKAATHPADSAWHIVSGAWRRDDSVISVLDGNTLSAAAGADASPWKHCGIFIGAGNAAGLEPLRGEIAEIMLYSKELQESERLAVEAYLKNKYFCSAPEEFKVTFMAGADGGIVGITEQIVALGADCSPVMAVPNAGFVFDGWSGDVQGLSNPLQIGNIRRNMTAIANFARKKAALTISASGGGSVSPGQGTHVFNSGEKIVAKAVPYDGNVFKGWQVSGLIQCADPAALETSFTLSGDGEACALFQEKKLCVEFHCGPDGSIIGEAIQFVAPGGACTQVAASPRPNYRFTKWSGSYKGTENPLKLSKVTKNMSLFAQFEIIDGDNDGMPDFWENANGLKPADASDAPLDPDNDKLSNLQEFRNSTDPHNPDTDGDSYDDGQEVSSGTDPNDPLSMPGHKLLISQGTVEVPEGSSSCVQILLSNAPPAGSVTVAVSRKGGSDEITLASAPELIFTSENWNMPKDIVFHCAKDGNASVKQAEFIADAGTTFGKKKISVVEKESEIQVWLRNGAGGTTSPSGELAVIPGQTVEATAVPSPNFRFVKWMGVPEELSTDNPLSITITETSVILANFARNTTVHRYRVEVDGVPGGWQESDRISTGGPGSDLTLSAYQPDPLEGNVASTVLASALPHKADSQSTPSALFDNFNILGSDRKINEGFESDIVGFPPAAWLLPDGDHGNFKVSDSNPAEGAKCLEISVACAADDAANSLRPPGSKSNFSPSSLRSDNSNRRRQALEGQSTIYLPNSATSQDAALSFSIKPSDSSSSSTVSYNGLDLRFASGNFEDDPAAIALSSDSWHNVQISFDKMTDTDFDGLDDDWEILHFGNLDQDANGDFDKDGVSNIKEFLAESDPKTATPLVKFAKSSITVDNSEKIIEVEIVLSKPAEQVAQASVRMAKSDGQEGADFIFSPQTATFAPGETSGKIKFHVLNGADSDSAKFAVLELSSALGAGVAYPDRCTVNILPAAEDSDNDGLPDPWEMKFFGNLDQKPDFDPDNDGASNLAEFKQGRHPNAGARRDIDNRIRLKASY